MRHTGPAKSTGDTAAIGSVARLMALGALVVSIFFLHAAHSIAAEHLTVTGEYGKSGPASTGLGNGCRIGYQSSSRHLYLFSDERIYGLSVSTGSAVPLGGKFPLEAGINSNCAVPDFEVDNSGTGGFYAAPDSEGIFGWSSAGDPLAAPWPVNAGGETCGVAVTGAGQVWGGNYHLKEVSKFTAAGASAGSIPVGFGFCKLTVDPLTDDLYVAPYESDNPLVKYTAASGYTTTMNFPAAEASNPGLAVNGAEHKLYVGNGTSQVRVYNTETGSLVETIDLGQSGGEGLAVDEASDTLFVTVGSGATGTIREYSGLTLPKATTGEPTGNSEVSGIADPNGAGPITECYFEFGLSTAYGSTQNCSESLPIASEESVHAKLPGLIDEEDLHYHYRLVLATAAPNVINRGEDKTIAPHNVNSLTTGSATEITQQSATLNGSYEGTGEDTHYYFEWGSTAAYGNQTPALPGEDAGVTSGPTPIEVELSGLTPGVTYHYRAVAKNDLGISKAADRTFKTFEPPSFESFTSSNLTATSADIEAKINPNGFETKYRVEYGTSSAYGSVAPIPDGVLAAVSSGQGVVVPLTNLQSVTYHFRVIAENKWGTTETGDQTFNFFPESCPNAHVRQETGSEYLPDCRAYELVSPSQAGGITFFTGSGPAGPYATDPARFALAGDFGEIPGTEPTNSDLDQYIATRTNVGWVSHYVGLSGSETLGNEDLVGDLGFNKFLNITGFGLEGVPQPPRNRPFVWDSLGNSLGRWPADISSTPNAEAFKGSIQPSPDFSHLAFSSNNVAFVPGGLTTAPGSAYDYDTTTGTTALISRDANGAPIAQEPGNHSSTEEFILFPGVDTSFGTPTQLYPGVSTDGSHILMSTSSGPYNQFSSVPPVRLYMRVDDAVTYEVSEGHHVDYVGMTADGSKVFFTSEEKLTTDDHDTSTDLYMWSAEKDENEEEPLTLISTSGMGTGNTDACSASWTEKCGVRALETGAVPDNSIAAANGDIYFYSPEQLDGSKGSAGAMNLYVYRNGEVQFVESGSHPVTRIQVSPDGSHMAFITANRLTPYNNAGFAEMYSYNPATDNTTCVSCLPSGAPPTGNVTGSLSGLFMSNDGRTFFYTPDALVPHDTNDLHDVYEFSEGRPQLITTGTGSRDSSVLSGRGPGLAGVSADGVNVYFATNDTLVQQDQNGQFIKFYDARTGGGFPFHPALAPCAAADECHGPGSSAPTPPELGSSGDLGAGGNAAHQKEAARKHRGKRRKSHQKKNKQGHHGKRNRGSHHG